MPELTFRPILDGNYSALEYEFASPEELQHYMNALVVDIPPGHTLRVVTGVSKQKRPTLTLGLVKLDEPMTLATDQHGKPIAEPPPQVPRAMEVRQTIKDAKDADLELMAARAGITVTEAWRKRTRVLREADVEKGMRKTAGG